MRDFVFPRIPNVHNIPYIHAIMLILSLKLDWSHFQLNVRRNLRNSLVKVSDAGWIVLGRPEWSEDKPIEKFWEQQKYESVGPLLSDSKEDVPNIDEQENGISMVSEDLSFDVADSEMDEPEYSRLPTGKSEMR